MLADDGYTETTYHRVDEGQQLFTFSALKTTDVIEQLSQRSYT